MERDSVLGYRTNSPEISTHTLTWSVTGDLVLCGCNISFQLTRSRGAWRSSTPSEIEVKEFQLTRSRGATFSFRFYHKWRNISTHTLTWSVTLYEIKLKELRKFQLTRSRGAWLLIPLTALHASEFQLTRSRGAWHNSAVSLAWEWKFQLTRSRGAWP